MAIATVSATQATIIGVTTTANLLTGGLFTLPLTSPVLLAKDMLYYFILYNQVNGSLVGANEQSTGGPLLASPAIIFRTQNVSSPMTVGTMLSTSTSVADAFTGVWLAVQAL